MLGCIIDAMLFSRWMPPPLPTAKSPEHEKESGSTYAAGRSRVQCHLEFSKVILISL